MNKNSGLQIFGEFPHEISSSDEYLTIHFSPSSVPRKRRWSNYGLSADFLGDYFAAFFPGDEIPESKINRRDTVKSAVSFIANELIENAVKYSEETFIRPISISLFLYEEAIIFQVTNHAQQAIAEKYQHFIQRLLNEDPGQFYIEQLEKAGMGMGESCMGIVTMIHDYSAKMGWKFQLLEENSKIVQVSVNAHLDV